MINDVFKPVANRVDQWEFSVFNLWGERMFVTSDISLGWDGTFGDELVQAGIYQWSITGTNLLTGVEFEKHGFLNIFR